MKALGLSGWAKIAEIVSGIGVVVSLLIVAHSVNQNTIAIRSSSDDAVYAALRDVQTERFSSPELAQAIARLRSEEPLTPTQRVMWEQYQTLILSIWENAYLDRGRAVISQSDWEGWDAYFTAYFSDEHEGLTGSFWTSTRDWYATDFADHVERQLFAK